MTFMIDYTTFIDHMLKILNNIFVSCLEIFPNHIYEHKFILHNEPWYRRKRNVLCENHTAKNCFRVTCNRLVLGPVGELHPAFVDYLGTGGGFSRLRSRKGSFICLHKHTFIQSVCAWATSTPPPKTRSNPTDCMLYKNHTHLNSLLLKLS